jgi:diguanylate cyclase (GGDEF)-like protein
MFGSKKIRLSLRSVLTVPYVALVIVLALTIAGLSYQTGSKATETIASSLLRETAARIGLAVEKQMLGSSMILDAAFPTGLPVKPITEQDFPNFRSRFWVASGLSNDSNSYIYYGNRSGQAYGLKRLGGDDAELRVKLKADQTREFYRFSGIDGKPTFYQKEEKLFDPTQRPWYKLAATQDQHVWTPVYIDFSSGDLVATRAKRVMGVDQKLEGVAATDVSLHNLNMFFSALKVSQNGVALLIEPDGNLIASSLSANVGLNTDGSKHRINAAATGHPLITSLYNEVKQRLSSIDLTKTNGPTTFHFEDADGKAVYAAIDRLTDKAGLSWITLVAMPRSDFMAGLSENLERTAMLSFLAAIVAILLGYAVLNWVTRDLRRLSEVARRVGNGQLDAPVEIHRDDEIGQLADSFERMQKRMLTDELTGLANREAFGLKLQRRTQKALTNRTLEPKIIDRFAVLFIDLNQFKHVNDELGHNMGDQVLIETGERILGAVGKKDFVARISGDEFAVLIDDVLGAEALEKIRVNMFLALGATPVCLAGTSLKNFAGGGSVGTSLFPDDGINPTALLKKADRRMYRQKFARRDNTADRRDPLESGMRETHNRREADRREPTSSQDSN